MNGTRSGANALAVMAKCPEVSSVKTRLASQIGIRLATDLYRAFIYDLRRLAAPGLPWTLHWAFTPRESTFAWTGGGGVLLPQHGADLGERLANVFRDLAARGFGSIVVVASDSPHIPVAWLREAFRRLAEYDVVLGPADDGGYYLIGLREAVDVFRGVAWSTDAVLSQTIARAHHLGLSTFLLPRTFDVDEASDLQKLAEFATPDGERDPIPRARALLASMHRP